MGQNKRYSFINTKTNICQTCKIPKVVFKHLADMMYIMYLFCQTLCSIIISIKVCQMFESI